MRNQSYVLVGIRKIAGLLGVLVWLFILADRAQAAEPAFVQSTLGNAKYRPQPADMDGDGDLDLVVLDNDSPLDLYHTYMQPYWLENEGNGKFVGHAVGGWLAGFMRLAPADLNGDGKMDLIMEMMNVHRADVNVGIFAWLENDGAKPPNFIPHAISISHISNIYDLADICASDINGDGKMDIVANYDSGIDYIPTGMIYWYENDGANPPHFTPHKIADTTKEARKNKLNI